MASDHNYFCENNLVKIFSGKPYNFAFCPKKLFLALFEKVAFKDLEKLYLSRSGCHSVHNV